MQHRPVTQVMAWGSARSAGARLGDQALDVQRQVGVVRRAQDVLRGRGVRDHQEAGHGACRTIKRAGVHRPGSTVQSHARLADMLASW